MVAAVCSTPFYGDTPAQPIKSAMLIGGVGGITVEGGWENQESNSMVVTLAYRVYFLWPAPMSMLRPHHAVLSGVAKMEFCKPMDLTRDLSVDIEASSTPMWKTWS